MGCSKTVVLRVFYDWLLFSCPGHVQTTSTLMWTSSICSTPSFSNSLMACSPPSSPPRALLWWRATPEDQLLPRLGWDRFKPSTRPSTMWQPPMGSFKWGRQAQKVYHAMVNSSLLSELPNTTGTQAQFSLKHESGWEMFGAIFCNAFQGCDYFVSDIFVLANVFMRSSLLVG